MQIVSPQRLLFLYRASADSILVKIILHVTGRAHDRKQAEEQRGLV